MQKIFLCLLSFTLVFQACKKDVRTKDNEPEPLVESRSCAAENILKMQLASDPTLERRMQSIEDFTRRAVANGTTLRTASGEMVVPVVVHVLYNNSQENISDAQVQSQIDVLNEDFNLTNKDAAKIPQLFSDRKGLIGIRFKLVQTVRKYTAIKSWPANDAMKYTAKGGSDVIDPEHKLNIWVCTLQDFLGYAQFPGGNPKTDGIVCGNICFGRTGKLHPSFNKGRTVTHEAGHWMNLRHIWGDVQCGNDLVEDTPQATIYNFGCPSFPKYNSCAKPAVEMTMNYMDYTNDACMFMFTAGQGNRMKAIFLNGGPRASFFQ